MNLLILLGIFSAHSVPVLALDFGDPYIDQIYDNSHRLYETELSKGVP